MTTGGYLVYPPPYRDHDRSRDLDEEFLEW